MSARPSCAGGRNPFLLRSLVLRLALLLSAAAGCSPQAGIESPAATASIVATAPEATAPEATPTERPSPLERASLPAGFPVLQGAAQLDLPDNDPGLIGMWSTDQFGSVAYDFYAGALPAAGYPIVGLYPGEGVGIIRFRVADGAIWQMVVHSALGGGFDIEIRLDRP